MSDVSECSAARGADTPLGRLTLLCARARLSGDEDVRDDLEHLLAADGIPWDAVTTTLVRHGLALIFRHLVRQTQLDGLLPVPVREELESLYRGSTYGSLFLEAALRRIGDTCASRGIDLVVLKGLFLSRVVYELDDVRPVGDIDLLLRPEDALRLREVLQGLGYREYNRPTQVLWKRETEYMVFRGGTPEVMIDVHTLVVPEERFRVRQHRRALESAVWEGSRSSDRLGAPLRELRPEHLLVYLCAHLTVRHTFGRAIWLVDLREVLRYYEGKVDFDLLRQCAQEWRLATFVYFGLLGAQRYAGADVPDDVLERLRPRYRGARVFEAMLLAGQVFDTLSAAPVPQARWRVALMRDTRPARVVAVLALPYHEARRALRHWEPWVDLKRRLSSPAPRDTEATDEEKTAALRRARS
jgi:hypothetical protein